MSYVQINYTPEGDDHASDTPKQMLEGDRDAEVWFMCPACDSAHMIQVPEQEALEINPNRPHLGLMRGVRVRRADGSECVAHLMHGRIRYSRHSTHRLAGQSVGMLKLTPEHFETGANCD